MHLLIVNLILGCGTPSAPVEEPTTAAIDCAKEPPRPRCPGDEGGACAEQWAKVHTWEAACEPAEPVDCAQEPPTPKCPPSSSEACGEEWAKVTAWRASCGAASE